MIAIDIYQLVLASCNGTATPFSSKLPPFGFQGI